MNISMSLMFRQLHACTIALALAAVSLALPVQAQDRQTVDAHLARLDRLIQQLEQELALREQSQVPHEGLSQSVPPPPSGLPPSNQASQLAGKDDCSESVDELRIRYQDLQKDYEQTNRRISAADKQLAGMRERVRENGYACDRKMTSELDEFIEQLEWMTLQEARDQVVHVNLCIENRGEEINKKMETANHMRLERLMRSQNQVRQITGGTTDLWQEYENFLSKQRRLLQESREIKQECVL